MMKQCLPLVGVLLTLLAADAAPPNILLILTDDQGWSQLSAPIHPDVADSRSAYLHTPNMDRIGREGLRFTSGYSPAPLCTPTRRSILCGTSAARSGTEFASSWVPAKHLTIPRALKQANPAYQCAHFGKWGEQMISSPQECGYLRAATRVSSKLPGNLENGSRPQSMASSLHLPAAQDLAWLAQASLSRVSLNQRALHYQSLSRGAMR